MLSFFHSGFYWNGPIKKNKKKHPCFYERWYFVASVLPNSRRGWGQHLRGGVVTTPGSCIKALCDIIEDCFPDMCKFIYTVSEKPEKLKSQGWTFLIPDVGISHHVGDIIILSVVLFMPMSTICYIFNWYVKVWQDKCVNYSGGNSWDSRDRGLPPHSPPHTQKKRNQEGRFATWGQLKRFSGGSDNCWRKWQNIRNWFWRFRHLLDAVIRPLLSLISS